jgi:hypothetical protein
MGFRRFVFSLILVFCGSFLQAGELSPEVLAKFIKIVAADGKVSCKDPTLKAALEAAGVGVDAGSRIVWCTNANEVKMGKMSGKLCLVGRSDLLSSGCGIAFLEDGGKPKIMINKAAIAASGVNVPPALFKVGESQ